MWQCGRCGSAVGVGVEVRVGVRVGVDAMVSPPYLFVPNQFSWVQIGNHFSFRLLLVVIILLVGTIHVVTKFEFVETVLKG